MSLSLSASFELDRDELLALLPPNAPRQEVEQFLIEERAFRREDESRDQTMNRLADSLIRRYSPDEGAADGGATGNSERLPDTDMFHERATETADADARTAWMVANRESQAEVSDRALQNLKEIMPGRSELVLKAALRKFTGNADAIELAVNELMNGEEGNSMGIPEQAIVDLTESEMPDGEGSSQPQDGVATEETREIPKTALEARIVDTETDLSFARPEESRPSDGEEHAGSSTAHQAKHNRKRKIPRSNGSVDSTEEPLKTAHTSSSPPDIKIQGCSSFEWVDTITKKHPGTDPQWIYRRLEAGISPEKLMLELEIPNPADFQTPPSSQPTEGEEEVSTVEFVDDEAEVPGPGPSGLARVPSVIKEKMGFLSDEDKKDLKYVLGAFPDVDPMHVLQQIVEQSKTADQLVDDFARNTNYPKLKRRQEKERREKRRQELLDPERFQPAVFLRNFEDPEAHFVNEERQASALYVEHARVQLMNDFPNLRQDYIEKVMGEHNNLYLPTLRAIQQNQVETGGLGSNPGSSRGRGRGQPRGQRKKANNILGPAYLPAGRTKREEWPENIEETFFRELQYALFEQIIKDHIQEGAQSRTLKMVRAVEEGSLETCDICADDEVLSEDMVTCKAGRHKFCRSCIRSHAETQIGDGKHRIKCLSPDCEEGDNNQIDIEALKSILPPNLIDLMLRRAIDDDINRAGFENIERCPFCQFCMILEDVHDRIFRCQNPDCLKESCRECHQDSHIPLRCDEVIRADEAAMLNYVANQMSEAMVRECPACKKRSIKSEGCNHMTCPCGTHFCYVCKEQLDPAEPYRHFQTRIIQRINPQTGAVENTKNKKRCPANTTIEEVNADVAEKAGKEAQEKFLKDHPDLDQSNKKKPEVEKLVDRAPPPNRLDFLDSDDDLSDEEFDEEALDAEELERHRRIIGHRLEELRIEAHRLREVAARHYEYYEESSDDDEDIIDEEEEGENVEDEEELGEEEEPENVEDLEAMSAEESREDEEESLSGEEAGLKDEEDADFEPGEADKTGFSSGEEEMDW